MFALIDQAYHHLQTLWVEDYSKWTPATNKWTPNKDPAQDWIGPTNPFGPVIPVGAHGLGNTAPPAFIGDGWNGNSGGWASGECHTQGIAKCGQGPDTMVDPRILDGSYSLGHPVSVNKDKIYPSVYS